MRHTQLALLVAALSIMGAGAVAQTAPPAAPQTIVVDVDTAQKGQPVSKYLFGMFIEHIGKTMYGPLWAEMLDDRKFYFPITASDPETKGKQEGLTGRQLHQWRPVGGAEFVAMDKNKPFVGEQSPRITLDKTTPHGIRQTGLALIKGKRYTGRIYLRGTPGSHASVSLIWGTGERERQTIPFTALGTEYRKFTLAFTAPADAEEASVEIDGTGTGDFHIGAVSLMPADNIHGFRPDTIALLGQIKSGFWRFGGNYTSNYTWYNAIGDPDKRPPEWDFAWNQMQTNDLGMDEFAEFCKLIGVEAYISVNAGLGDSHSAAEQVEYMNGAVSTRLGAMRAKNGHPEPYRIQLWNIGNEPWGSWQIGRTDTKYFMQKHNEFARAMRKEDPSIVLIASGQMLEDGNVHVAGRAGYIGNLGPLYGTGADWTGSFLKDCWGNFDGIAEHWYASPGVHFDLEKVKTLAPEASSEAANVKVDQTLLEYARYPANIVRVKAEEWLGYQQRFPSMVDKKIFLSIDEYAYFGGGFGHPTTLKTALAYGMTFNEMLRYTGFLTMAAHTMGTSTLDFNRTASALNPLGLVFKMYSNNFPGSIPVAVTGNSLQPAPRYPVGGDQPKLNSGSPTYPLDVFAAITPDHRFLALSVVNATASAQHLDLNVSGVRLAGKSTLSQITASSLDAFNQAGQAPQVVVVETAAGEQPSSLTIAPMSVDIYRFAIVGAEQ